MNALTKESSNNLPQGTPCLEDNKKKETRIHMSKTEVIESNATNALAVSALPDTIEASDIDIPRVNVVQKTSDFTCRDGEDAPLGALVLDKTFILADPEENILVTPVNAIKYWTEDVPYDNDKDIAKVVGTIEEKNKLKLTSKFPIMEFAEITFLFEGNDDVEAFPLPLGKKNYAIGKLRVQKDAYRQVFKRLTTFGLYNKKTPVHKRLWNLKSTLLTRGKYSWYCPLLAITKDLEPSEEVESFVEGYLLP